MFCYIEKLSNNIKGNEFVVLFWRAHSRPRQD